MDVDRLCYMANQIAQNFAIQGDDAAVQETAQHIRNYWDPRMKAAILNGDREGLNALARKAIDALRPEPIG